MPTLLLDWLYTDIKQGALILFPHTIDRWNIAALVALVASNIQKIAVVTDCPNEFMDAVDYTVSRTLSVIKYSDIEAINQALNTVDIVLFDDARMLAIISPALQFIPNTAKILVLTTWGDTLRQLNIVMKQFPNLHLLSLDIIGDDATITWRTIRTPMSQRTLRYYDLARARENTAPISDQIVPYSFTRRLTLYTYPDNIMLETLSHGQICEADQSSIPDALSPSTWITPSHIENLPLDGAKLFSILDGIVANWTSKQIVITRYNHRYGVDLITSFLQLMSQSRLNPYELDEIFHIACTDPYETMIATLNAFNTSTTGVIVTNVVPLLPLKGVSIIHIADNYSFLNLQAVLSRIHKRHLNSSITIYSHLATHPHEKSSDEALYENLEGYISETNRIYSELKDQGTKVMLDPSIGLYIP